MNFWSWLFSVSPAQKSYDEYDKEIAELKEQVLKLEKEVCHWKSMALNFRRFHQ